MFSVMEDEKARQCTIAWKKLVQSSASAARTHANDDLRIHLRSLVGRADLSDLEFICKDEVRVQACRILLMGRSPVLDKMLTNGMLETTSSTINVPEISSSSLLSILEFLYTGDIFHYQPKDWRTGLEIMSAAHFFLLSDIHRIVQEYLVAEIARVVTNFQHMAVMLTVAMTFKSLSHDEDVILLQLVRLLEGKWMDINVICCVSEKALDFILRRSKSISKEEDCTVPSLIEYFRFRGIMLWCVCNSCFVSGANEDRTTPKIKTDELGNTSTPSVEANEPGNEVTSSLKTKRLVSEVGSSLQAKKRLKRSISVAEAGKLVNGAIPLAKEELYKSEVTESGTIDVRWLPDGTGTQDEMIQVFLSHQACKEAAIRLLENVDLVRIPATLFVKVIDPLKLIPDSRLMDIFRFHLLHRPMRVKLNWVHKETYEVLKDGFVLRKLTGYGGSAMCQLANRFADEVCMWRFTVEEVCPDIQLGFLCGEELEEASRAWNPNRDCLSALGASGVEKKFMSRVACWLGLVLPAASSQACRKGRMFFKRGEGGNLDGMQYSDAMEFLGGQVEFRYHRTKRSCDISVDGKDFGTMWRLYSLLCLSEVMVVGGSA